MLEFHSKQWLCFKSNKPICSSPFLQPPCWVFLSLIFHWMVCFLLILSPAVKRLWFWFVHVTIVLAGVPAALMNYPSWTNEVSVKLARVHVFTLSLQWFLFLQVAACSESFRQIEVFIDICRLSASWWRNEFCECIKSKHRVNIQVCWM